MMMSKFASLIILSVLSFPAVFASENVTQYIALAYINGIVSWEEVTFPTDYTATSASEVSIRYVTGDTDIPDVIGDLQNLNMGAPPLLTVRTHDNLFYSQMNTGKAPMEVDGYPGGCCVDTFRQWSSTGGGAYTEWDLLNIIRDTLGSSAMMDNNTGLPWIYANHVFDVVDFEGSLVAMLDITYLEPDLEGAIADGFAMFNLETSEFINTMDGQPWFATYQNVGTRSTDPADGIYKLMYNCTGYDCQEQFHQNGLTRFQASDGTWVIAVTYMYLVEATLFKCPFAYSSTEGGGSILQRFGSPPQHTFGLSPDDMALSHVHNVYYTLYPDGAETITMYVNNRAQDNEGTVFEFDLKLTPEPSGEYDDTIFATNYLSAGVGFSNPSWGGARPIGRGVWLVGYHNVTVCDLSADGKRRLQNDDPPPMDDDEYDPHQEIYDPFAFFV